MAVRDAKLAAEAAEGAKARGRGRGRGRAGRGPPEDGRRLPVRRRGVQFLCLVFAASNGLWSSRPDGQRCDRIASPPKRPDLEGGLYFAGVATLQWEYLLKSDAEASRLSGLQWLCKQAA